MALRNFTSYVCLKAKKLKRIITLQALKKMKKNTLKKHAQMTNPYSFDKNNEDESKEDIVQSKQILTQKQQIFYKQKTPYEPGINQGDWTIAQNIRYMKFLCKYKEDMQSDQVRRRKKIFTLMQKGIYSRTANQCRSHHQKYIKKYHSIDLIVEFINLMAKTVNFPSKIQNKQANKIPKSEQRQRPEYKVAIQNDKIKIQISIKNISSWKKQMQIYIQ